MEKASLTTGESKYKPDDEQEISLCIRVLRKIKSVFLNNLLLFSTLLGVGFGFVVGFAVRATQPSENALMWLGLPGQLYLRLLKMMIVPLIACSVICGAAALDPKANGKISLIAFVFIISTNALGSALGIGSVYMFNPGKSEIKEQDSVIEGNMQTQDILADLIRNIIPENLFESTFSQTQTMYKVKNKIIEVNTTDGLKNETVKEVSKYLGKMGNPNIIGLIFACTLLGLAAANLKSKGKPFLDFIQSVSDTVIAVVRWFMWTTPVGVISLIAVSIASIESVEEVFAQLGLFIVAITVGITFQQLVLMAGIFFAFTRKNPYSYLISIARPWMISFAATSTAVAIPEMMAACEDKNKIDKRISRFVIPFSVTISCNGSALYIAGACVFIANLTGTSLALGDVLLIWLLVTVAAMAIPSVPSASIMTTIMILSSMNIPMDDIALLLAVEWYLDRIRSTSSVVSHTFCTAVVYSLCKKDLADIDRKHKHDHDIEKVDEEEMQVIVENGKIMNGFADLNGVIGSHSLKAEEVV
ncbi:excitatory amino acid transporter-like [Mercenaria mercenaria]|uniref:excitatory amino acid transporter-like n=1 Tax=Mercenaria mercenaria TaxID=6596 RepID=UPI00234EC44F|nr:excitatory amino acid transporter-like [Mercenaria mercenaria]XP_053403403.1 excitatory amino acid transporter-like [Mercenaria mercenaria]XP_053403404.1 excitatory amino acid transporter-like [Mercenaria mercenaria]